ncbi:MAG TPA: hypothetical protein VN695_14430 [Streptosporangiaceae bacterium]|nr:hypothetical protein [Streptosporangiaceae bacterium]
MALLAGQIGGERNATRQPQPFLDRLEGLAAELARRGLRTKLSSPLGRIPSLHVANPSVSRLAEDVYVGRSRDGVWWFWWPWAERIASADNAGHAADLIAKVLDANE